VKAHKPAPPSLPFRYLLDSDAQFRTRVRGGEFVSLASVFTRKRPSGGDVVAEQADRGPGRLPPFRRAERADHFVRTQSGPGRQAHGIIGLMLGKTTEKDPWNPILLYIGPLERRVLGP